MSKRFLTKTNVAERYGVSTRTIDRWLENPPPAFPAPIMLNGRKRWDEDLCEVYERHCAATNASKTGEAGVDA